MTRTVNDLLIITKFKVIIGAHPNRFDEQSVDPNQLSGQSGFNRKESRKIWSRNPFMTYMVEVNIMKSLSQPQIITKILNLVKLNMII